eukprot:scaffold2482_cov131-Isochrysis_galbana.AAC.4
MVDVDGGCGGGGLGGLTTKTKSNITYITNIHTCLYTTTRVTAQASAPMRESISKEPGADMRGGPAWRTNTRLQIMCIYILHHAQLGRPLAPSRAKRRKENEDYARVGHVPRPAPAVRLIHRAFSSKWRAACSRK